MEYYYYLSFIPSFLVKMIDRLNLSHIYFWFVIIYYSIQFIRTHDLIDKKNVCLSCCCFCLCIFYDNVDCTSNHQTIKHLEVCLLLSICHCYYYLKSGCMNQTIREAAQILNRAKNSQEIKLNKQHIWVLEQLTSVKWTEHRYIWQSYMI